MDHHSASESFMKHLDNEVIIFVFLYSLYARCIKFSLVMTNESFSLQTIAKTAWWMPSWLGLDCSSNIWKCVSSFSSGKGSWNFLVQIRRSHRNLREICVSSRYRPFSVVFHPFGILFLFYYCLYNFNIFQEMAMYHLTPSFEYQEDPWKYFSLAKKQNSGKKRIGFKEVAK